MPSVLDALSQRDRTQHNTFVRWLNLHLANARGGAVQIADLSRDLSDGVNLCKFAEVIIPTKLAFKENPKNELQCVNNVTVALTAFNRDGVELLNIHSTTIAKGDIKSILGMIWQLLQVYQIASVTGEDDEDDELLAEIEALAPEERQSRLKARRQAKSKNLKDLKSNLLLFVNNTLGKLTEAQKDTISALVHHPAQPTFHVGNLDSDWQDGSVISGLVVALDENPEMALASLRADVDMRVSHGQLLVTTVAAGAVVSAEEKYSCLVVSAAIDHAERSLDIPPLMDAEDMVLYPDSQATLAYVSFFKKAHVAQRASQRSTPLQTPRGLSGNQHARNGSLMTVMEEEGAGDGFAVDDDSEDAPLTEVRLLARERRARSMSKGGGESLPLLESALRATVVHIEAQGMEMDAAQLQRFTEHVKRLEVSVNTVSARVMREEDAKIGEARIADDVRNITSAANEAAVEASKVAVEAIERATVANKAREEMKVELDRALAELERLRRELGRKEKEVEEKAKEKEEVEKEKKKVEEEKARVEEEKRRVEEVLGAKEKAVQEKEEALRGKEAELRRLEEERDEKEEELERAIADKEEKESEVEEKEEEITELQMRLSELEATIAQEREEYEKEIADVREEVEEERKKREEAEREKEDADRDIRRLEEERDAALRAAVDEKERREREQEEKEKAVASLREEKEAALAAAREEKEKEVAAVKEEKAAAVSAVEEARAAEVAEVEKAKDVAIAVLTEEKERELAALRREKDEEMTALGEAKDAEIASLRRDLGGDVAALREEMDRERAQVKAEREELERAVARTQAEREEDKQLAEDRIAALEQRMREKEDCIVSLNEMVAEQEKATGVLAGENKALSERVEQQKNVITDLGNTIEELESDVKREKASREDIEGERDTLKADKDALTTEHANLLAAHEALRVEKEAVAAESAVAKAENESLRARINELEAQVASLEAGAATAQSTNETLQGRIDALESDKATLESQAAELTATKVTLEEEVEAARAQTRDLEATCAQLREDGERVQTEYTKLVEVHAIACEDRDTAVGRACEAESALEEEQRKVEEAEGRVEEEKEKVQVEKKRVEIAEDKLLALEELHSACTHAIECGEAERKRLDAELASVSAQLESQRAQTEAGDATIEQLEKALAEARAVYESNVISSDERVAALTKECSELKGAVEREKQEREEKEQALRAEEEARAVAETEREAALAATGAAEAALTALTRERDELSAALAAVREELASTGADRDAVRVSVRALEDALQEQQEREGEREEREREERERREEELREAREELERLQADLLAVTSTLDSKSDEMQALQGTLDTVAAEFAEYQAANPPAPETMSKFVQTDFSSSMSSLGSGAAASGDLALEQSRVSALKREFAAYRSDKERELAELLQLTSQAQCENEELCARVVALEQLLREQGLWDEHADYLAQYRRKHGIDPRSSRSGLIDRAQTLLDSLTPQVGITITKQPAPEGGVRVLKVLIGRAGYNAGLQPGEVIEQVNGIDTHTNHAFAQQFARVAQAGAVVSLQVVGRRGSQGEMYVRNVQVEIGSKRVPCGQIRELRRVASGVVKAGDVALLEDIERLQSEGALLGAAESSGSLPSDDPGYIDEEDMAQLAAMDHARVHTPAAAAQSAAVPVSSPRHAVARPDRLLSPVKAAGGAGGAGAGYLSPRARPSVGRISAGAVTPLSPRTRSVHTPAMAAHNSGRALHTPARLHPSSASPSSSHSLSQSLSFTEDDTLSVPTHASARAASPVPPVTTSVPVTVSVPTAARAQMRTPRPTATSSTSTDASSPGRRMPPRDTATPARSSAAALVSSNPSSGFAREVGTPVRDNRSSVRDAKLSGVEGKSRDSYVPPSSRLMERRRAELANYAGEVGSQADLTDRVPVKRRSEDIQARAAASATSKWK